MPGEFHILRNPRKWRFTWETLANIPTLRLFLFNSEIEPVNLCKHLKVSLNLEDYLLLVRWIEDIEDQQNGAGEFLLSVPVPRVLIDLSSPVEFKATKDHIEVKLVLLLPVDHPILADFRSTFDPSEKGNGQENGSSNRLQSLSLDSDLSSLSCSEGVHFFCKSCSTQLTRRPLSNFAEMPSVNWREVADNWFGACCCSFGGISEKLVTKYVSSYSCAEGKCLVNATSVIVCKDDFAGYESTNHPDISRKIDLSLDFDSHSKARVQSGYDNQGLFNGNPSDEVLNTDVKLSSLSLNKENSAANLECEITERGNDVVTSLCASPSISDISGEMGPVVGLSAKDLSHCCGDKILNHDDGGSSCSHGVSGTCSKIEDQESTKGIEFLMDQKSFLNGYLGNGFMVRSFNHSKDIDWIEVLCPHCSSFLGAYPYVTDGDAPVDGGVRLFKCYISTGLPVGGSSDIFKKHTLHRMFVNQLLENATDELSFRTVVRDLRTKSSMLQIVLLNSNAWSCTGYCLETCGIVGPVSKIDLHPVAKVLFSDCGNATEAQIRKIEEWTTKNKAEEVYMLAHQIKELTESLKSAQERLPISSSFMQGLSLSSLER